MKVFLPTSSLFLRHRLTRVRLALVGKSAFEAKTQAQPQPKSIKPRKSWPKAILNAFLTLIMVGSLVVALSLFVPEIYYRVFPAEVVPVTTDSLGTPLGGSFEASSSARNAFTYKPPVDKTLPEGEWLIIPRIGVRTQPEATEKSEDALDTGVWMVPDLGKPGDTTKPLILVSHRYGWQWWWKTDYWKYHSFYNLPQLEPGDRVEVISGQRKWIYEIYAGEEGTEITDYEADLILYTCKFLNSPVRHFRYARLIDPTKNTQE